MQVCLGRPSHRKHACVDISVFRWLGKQRPRFAQGQPKGSFQLKELHRTTKAYSHMNADWNWRRPNVLSSIRQHGQDCSLSAVQRKTTFVEQSRWPELSLFGPMPWCSFPCQKLLPKLAQKNCHTTVWIYPWKRSPTIADSILVSDQTDLFSFATHGDEYGKKSSPTETGKGGHWTPVFFCGCTSKGQDSPKASPRLFSNERTW